MAGLCGDRTPGEGFPATWLALGGGVCGRRSNGDTLRLFLSATPELRSPEPALFLLCGPTTNSSASSIIMPCGGGGEDLLEECLPNGVHLSVTRLGVRGRFGQKRLIFKMACNG